MKKDLKNALIKSFIIIILLVIVNEIILLRTSIVLNCIADKQIIRLNNTIKERIIFEQERIEVFKKKKNIIESGCIHD